MIAIRQSQFDEFERDRERQTVAHCVEYLRKVLPDQCTALGDERVRESAELAVKKAKSYGFVTEKQLLQLLNVMYWLGFDFEDDARYPWAKEILGSAGLDADGRAQRLKDRALEALRSNV